MILGQHFSARVSSRLSGLPPEVGLVVRLNKHLDNKFFIYLSIIYVLIFNP